MGTTFSVLLKSIFLEILVPIRYLTKQMEKLPWVIGLYGAKKVWKALSLFLFFDINITLVLILNQPSSLFFSSSF